MSRALVLALVMNASAWAAEPTCGELNKLYAETYRQDFKIVWPLKPFVCGGESSDFKIAKAIHDLHELSPDDTIYYDLVKQTVRRTSYSRECSTDYYAATMTKDGQLRICERFLKTQAVWRSSAIFHEAAHARKDDPGHVVCDHGAVKGHLSCDKALSETREAGSGYNWQLRYLKFGYENPARQSLDAAILRKAIEHLIFNRFNDAPKERVAKWLP